MNKLINCKQWEIILFIFYKISYFKGIKSVLLKWLTLSLNNYNTNKCFRMESPPKRKRKKTEHTLFLRYICRLIRSAPRTNGYMVLWSLLIDGIIVWWFIFICLLGLRTFTLWIELFRFRPKELYPCVNLQTKCNGTQKRKNSNVTPLPSLSPLQDVNSFEYV